QARIALAYGSENLVALFARMAFGSCGRNLVKGGSRKELLMDKALIGEFLGTMVLVLFGNGIVANLVLKKTKGEGSGWIVIVFGWMLAVTMGVFAAIGTGSADAHINPAVTLGLAISSGDYSKLLPYFVAQ